MDSIIPTIQGTQGISNLSATLIIATIWSPSQVCNTTTGRQFCWTKTTISVVV